MMTIDRLKEDITIDEVVEYLGGRKVSWGTYAHYDTWMPVTCPFHNDENASASMNRAKGRFKCHACDVSGDIVDLAREYLGDGGVRRAMDWLERTFL